MAKSTSEKRPKKENTEKLNDEKVAKHFRITPSGIKAFEALKKRYQKELGFDPKEKDLIEQIIWFAYYSGPDEILEKIHNKDKIIKDI